MSRRLVVAAVVAELGDVPGEALGVGPLRAAVRMTRLLGTGRPEAVLLVGSCGVYGERWPPGTAVVGDTLDFSDTAATLGLAYVPAPVPPLTANTSTLPKHLPRATVRTLVAITSDEAAARRHGVEAHVEHMETYGVALACAEAGVPFSVVLGVANRVGPGAHAEWLTHRAQAEAAAREVARDWLAAGGQIPAQADTPAG